ncbi:MAG: hypothetical protein ACE5G8_12810 [Anaerolineae bacterium]
MKKLLVLGLVLILVAALGTVVLAGDPDPGTGSVNFTVQNVTDTDTQAVASYINSSGDSDLDLTKDLFAKSSQGFSVADAGAAGLPDNWEGAVIVSAGQEIVAFAQARWQGGAQGDGKTAGAYNGFQAGANTLYFPSLVARDTKQFSKISIQSAEAASNVDQVTVNITFYDRDGNKEATTISQPIFKGSQMTWDLTTIALSTFVADGWIGSAVVTSTAPIAGVATTFWPEYSAAYSAVTSGGEKAYVAQANRRLPAGPFLQYTGVVVQNLKTTPVTATVRWYDRTGAELYSFDKQIAGNASQGFNTKNPANTPDPNALWTALGTDWVGSVIVEGPVGSELVAITNLQWTNKHPAKAAASSFASEAAGFATLNVPATFRTLTGNTYKQYTGLIVQNVGAADCASAFRVTALGT